MSTKLPYFRWHPKDFETDQNVKLMTMCEVGLYVMCLNHAWINGSLPNDVRKIAKIVGQPLSKVKKSWPAVSKCFELNSSENLVNSKQEKERVWARDRHTKAKEANAVRNQTAGFSGGEGLAKLEALRAYGSGSESDSSVLETSTEEKPTSRARTEIDPSEEVYPEDPIETFVVQAVSRENPRFKIKLDRRSDERNCFTWRNLETEYGVLGIRLAWIKFLRWFKAEDPDIDNPQGYFFTAVATWMGQEQHVSPRVSQPAEQGAALGRMLQMPALMPVAPPVPEQEGMPETVQRWNAEVPGAPQVRIWPPGPKERTLLASVVQDKRFVEHYGDLLQKCQQLRAGGGDKAKCLTFFWMLANWQKILNCGCDWMLSGDFAVQVKRGNDALRAKLLGKSAGGA